MACTGTRTDYDVVIFVVDAVYVALRVCRKKRPHVSSAADVSSKKARETVWGEEQMCLLYTHAASFRRPSYGIPRLRSFEPSAKAAWSTHSTTE